MYQSIRQEVTFKAKPETIYRMLMDAKAHSAFTGGPVELMNEIGGKLSAFGGAITGINIELVSNKRIVQMWRAGDWPAGHYSTATFELTAVEAGTQLAFTQTGVPENKYDEINKGWHEQYWDKIKAALEIKVLPTLTGLTLSC